MGGPWGMQAQALNEVSFCNCHTSGLLLTKQMVTSDILRMVFLPALEKPAFVLRFPLLWGIVGTVGSHGVPSPDFEK